MRSTGFDVIRVPVLFWLILLCIFYPRVQAWCSDFNMKASQFVTGTSCNIYKVPGYSLSNCGQLCLRINKCQYFTDVAPACFLCIHDSAQIQNVSNVILHKLPSAPSWKFEKLLYQKVDKKDHCTSGCVNGNCLLESDDITWKCHCHVNYTGVDCAESVNKVISDTLDTTTVAQTTALDETTVAQTTDLGKTTVSQTTAKSAISYALDETTVTQTTAKSNCQTNGGSLINVYNTDVIQSFEPQVLSSNCWYVWTSAERSAVATVWKWADGTQVDAQLWSNGFPTNNDGKDCVVYERSKKALENRLCGDGYCSLCQG